MRIVDKSVCCGVMGFCMSLLASVAIVGCGALLTGCSLRFLGKHSGEREAPAIEAKAFEDMTMSEFREAINRREQIAAEAKLAAETALAARQVTSVPGVPDLEPGGERVINAVVHQKADAQGNVTETIEHRYLIEFSKDGRSRVFANLVEDVDPALIRDLLEKATRTLYLPSGGR